MRYRRFIIEHYRAIESPLEINLLNHSLVPLIGVNECGKTTILQAIFAFDHVNDTEYEGRHLENTINLYQTTDRDPLITAEIEIAIGQLRSLWDESVNLIAKGGQKPALTGTSVQSANDIVENPIEFPISRSYSGATRITRNLNTKKYLMAEFSNSGEDIQDWFARQILRFLPYILYNDDFQDRPPSTIFIPSTKPDSLVGWVAIYEKLFQETNKSYSLFTTAHLDDKRRKDSIVSDVQDTLNNTLTKAWRTFQLDRTKQIKVRLEISNNELQINIVENVGQKERFFEIVDRSKGFLWFYNFVMKLEFNPKSLGNRKDTIYLLDEPGSYLHPAAQEKLCAKLKAISTKHGKVVFCTHSHHLLDPEQIPINSILIVSKPGNKGICVTPLPQYSTARGKVTALQPVFEALQISAAEFKDDDLPVLVVEGTYDKYAIQLFLPKADAFRIYPGTSADSILKNIQTLNAFGRVYVAIWDNDPEGRRTKKRAEDVFGPYEAARFDLLPSREGGDRKMEQMFDPGDLNMLRSRLNLSVDASYESIMSGLYYASPALRKMLVSEVGTITKSNFEKLRMILGKRLENSQKLLQADPV